MLVILRTTALLASLVHPSHILVYAPRAKLASRLAVARII